MKNSSFTGSKKYTINREPVFGFRGKKKKTTPNLPKGMISVGQCER